jgi:hypothetical protein
MIVSLSDETRSRKEEEKRGKMFLEGTDFLAFLT